MKLRITIDDPDTGRVHYRSETDGIAASVLAGKNTEVFMIGNFTPVDAAKLLDSLDDLKKDILKDNQAIALAYAMKDALFETGQTVTIDPEVLRRQMEEMK